MDLTYGNFKDVVEYYEQVDSKEWITIYQLEKIEKSNIKNDYAVFSALIKNDKKHIKANLKEADWGFDYNSFGKAFYGKIGRNVKGIFEEEIYFVNGTETKHAETDCSYLVAAREFYGLRKPSLEILPALIWFDNLWKDEENKCYKNLKKNDDIIIKFSETKIEVKLDYLRSFLTSTEQSCIIAFDHRRFINESQKSDYSKKREEFLSYDICISEEAINGFKSFSSIIGKKIICPYSEINHESYKDFQPKQYEQFIIGINKETGEDILSTCNENELSNFFTDKKTPQFLTPVYFKTSVFDNYNSSKLYNVSDGYFQYLNEWGIPYCITEEYVTVWLGDLGRIPFDEQKQFKRYNVRPKDTINKNFINQQLNCKFVDYVVDEKRIYLLVNTINTKFRDKFGGNLFEDLSLTDKYIKESLITPTNDSNQQMSNFIFSLCKITIESLNTKLLIKELGEKESEDEDGKTLGSIKLLGAFLVKKEYKDVELVKQLSQIQEIRSTLFAHTGTNTKYNKIFGRAKDAIPSFVIDAKILMNKLLESLEDFAEVL